MVEKEKDTEQPKGSYVENLIKNQNDPKAKKLLSNVSCLGNLEALDLNKICLTNVEQEENIYASANRKKIEENAKEKFKDKNPSKLRKFVDQSSSLFANELYGSNLNCNKKIFLFKKS